MKQIALIAGTALCILTCDPIASACPQTFDEYIKLLADDGAIGDRLGWSVGISGDTAIAGAWADDDNSSDSGSAYIFNTATGNQITKLLPNDGSWSDCFGWSVGISGATAIVGAKADDDNGSSSGSAYLFDTNTGVQIFKLLPSDGAAYDEFGISVAISNSIAIVGAYHDDGNVPDTGSAYLFNATSGTQLFKLLPNDVGSWNDSFGHSVAISGSIAIVGAYRDDDNGADSGSAYLFDTTTGTQLFKLLPGDGAAEDRFGYSVAISGTTAIVGTALDDDNGDSSGSAYLFDTNTGIQLFKLIPNDGEADDRFGGSVGIDGTTAIVGAAGNDDNGDTSGSAYIFDTISGAQIAKLLPSDGDPFDYFGVSVAMSGSTGLVGANHDDHSGTSSGSAYLFDESNNPCTNATPLLGDGVFAVDNTMASGPDADPGCAFIGPDVWYEWTATATGHVTMGMCDGTTAFDSALAAWDGPSGCPSVLITCNDDTCVFEPQVTFACVAGSVYMIQVGGFNGATGTGNLTIDTDPYPGTPFCFGDGSGTPCPCVNSGFPGEGCRNDTGFGGLLAAMHSNSITSDDLKFIATGLTPGPGLYFQGNNAINGGSGSVFGDGLRCVGNQVRRIEVQFSSGGLSSTTSSIADSGGVNAGDTKRYQLWYRDAGGSPCNSGFNLTNGYEITWTP